MSEEKKVYTTGFGTPVDNNLHSKTAGSAGPVIAIIEPLT